MIIQNRGGGNCGARDRTEWAPGGGEAGDEGFFVAWRGFSGKMLSVRFSKLPGRRRRRDAEEETLGERLRRRDVQYVQATGLCEEAVFDAFVDLLRVVA